MVTSRYFKEEEFKKCSPPCSLQDMQQDFMIFLDKIREIAGIPLSLTSAYRSVEHEKNKGRSGNSAHKEGSAVDIRAKDGRSKWQIVKAAIKVGFTRIGINKDFIHLDNSKTLDKEVIWLY
jgi:uncharacterized protein YcbK (DUF882 family)